MGFRYRLALLLLSISLLLVIGRFITGSFEFVFSDVWFTSGIFLVILISLIDQPFFSNNSDIFLNSITASTTLLLFPKNQRTPFWIAMLILILYLNISSYILMWVRKSKLKNEPRIVGFLSKINRELGKPTVLFSIFFIWGVIEKFGYNTVNANILFFFWSAFILLTIPSIAMEIEKLLTKKQLQDSLEATLLSITNPLTAFIKMEYNINISIGSNVSFFDKSNNRLAFGVLVDDRIIANDRIGKVKIKQLLLEESAFSDSARYPIKAKIDNSEINNDSISVVDIGTSIGKVQFFINPSLNLEEGELVWVKLRNNEKAYFQVVYEEIIEEKIEEKNEIQYVKIIAGQLGHWQNESSRFEQLKVVASAGEIINRIKNNAYVINIPNGHLKIGLIPNSNFPIHVKLDDIVTHNTAVLGVTGSGKSYLSFRIIEALIEQKVKVLILDPSRQHFSYLASVCL